jgi:hypothetical protein
MGTANPTPMNVRAAVGLASVDQRAAGAARIHRGVELDEPGQVRAVVAHGVPVQPGDDPRGRGTDQAQLVADSNHIVTHREPIGTAQYGRNHDRRQRAGAESGDVDRWVGLRDSRRGGGAVRERHLDRPSVLHHMERGQDGGIRVDDDARSEVDGGTAAGGYGFDRDHRRSQRGIDLGRGRFLARGGAAGGRSRCRSRRAARAQAVEPDRGQHERRHRDRRDHRGPAPAAGRRRTRVARDLIRTGHPNPTCQNPTRP